MERVNRQKQPAAASLPLFLYRSLHCAMEVDFWHARSDVPSVDGDFGSCVEILLLSANTANTTNCILYSPNHGFWNQPCMRKYLYICKQQLS
ncbi:hypothetical protein J0S82_000325 [Galemys pyrenaicus]|uniref:Uncharacterized protein n=1 Tax=Galemys pyrenaicus TaxID=202257 RepID=A0A8J5ZQG6_GALPY|nr:hypothetical protein J0S82_000325 [Galemys pyrenaicus]